MKYRILLFLMTLGLSAAIAQEKKADIEPIAKQTYITERLANFEYITFASTNELENLPLLIAFHYSGGNPAETLADYDCLKTPVRIIIPKGNFPKRNGLSYYPTNYYLQDSVTQYKLAMQTVDSLANFVAAIERKYNKTAVVSGISQGGDLSFLLAKHYSNLFLASFPFAAVIHSAINEELKERAIKKIPVYIFQGENDQIISHELTRKKVQEIGRKMTIKLFTYPDVGHEISPQMKSDYSKIIDKYLKAAN